MTKRDRTKHPKIKDDTAARALKALTEAGGNQRIAAGLMGVSKRRMEQIVGDLRANNYVVPQTEIGIRIGHFQPARPSHIERTTTLLGPDGQTKLQWVREGIKGIPSMEDLIKAAKQEFGDTKPLRAVPLAKGKVLKDLITVYPLGDPHIGMYSWSEETGQDFDLDIAKRNLEAATSHLVSCSPPTETALIINVGDFFHADNLENRTMRSGNVLDVDTRWAKVLRVGIRTMRTLIELALQKHTYVHVINEIGNHDDHSSQMLTICLSLYYENNPRVLMNESPARFHYHRFGKNFIGVTHGDGVKLEQLGQIMSTDRPKDWGETEFRYWYTGHIHHKRMLELPGCVVESFRTLAARDAWHAGKGYRSGRDMQAIVLDRNYGEVERRRIDIAMLEALFT